MKCPASKLSTKELFLFPQFQDLSTSTYLYKRRSCTDNGCYRVASNHALQLFTSAITRLILVRICEVSYVHSGKGEGSVELCNLSRRALGRRIAGGSAVVRSACNMRANAISSPTAQHHDARGKGKGLQRAISTSSNSRDEISRVSN